jgi:biopolymer transport protein ExbD
VLLLSDPHFHSHFPVNTLGFLNRSFGISALLSLPVAIILVTSAACNSKQDTYRQEAKAFCEVHNPNNWKEYANAPGSVDLQKEVNRRVSEVIHTREFKQIVADLDKIQFARELYGAAQRKISALTGEPWDCPYYQQFYAVSFEQKGTSVPDLGDKNTVVVSIDNNGNYTVNTMELMNNEQDTLKQAILKVAATPPPKVIVKTSENTPKEAIDAVMNTLHDLGVKNATLVTP